MKSNSTRSKSSASTCASNAKNEFALQKNACELHQFSSDEIQSLRDSLLEWFNTSKRDLPWRRLAAEEGDRNRRGYAVWVSEVMLQQTQVATVVDYYNKWMKRWPTLQHLSRATLEEVNEMWAGLGYYSRARRLHEGSRKVVNEMGGEMPADAANLIKYLPGVGRYTAGAIASIAFGEPTGVVDGNVVRVLSRLRVIGKDSSTSLAVDAFWKLVTELIDKERPGDFNQAMMELGATVCTPKTPRCKTCPVREACLAHKQAENMSVKSCEALKSYFEPGGKPKTEESSLDAIDDIENVVSEPEECQLCFANDGTWNDQIGVCNYPRKQKLKVARQETVAVCIMECVGDGKGGNNETLLFICKRPSTGLLAGLWEFPNVVVEAEGEWSDQKKDGELRSFLKSEFKIVLNDAEKPVFLGEVRHIFTHVHHTYLVQKVAVLAEKRPFLTGESTTGRSAKWVTTSEFLETAVSTAMKKVFNLYKDSGLEIKKGKGTKRKSAEKDDSRKQRVLESFFVRK